MDERTLNDLLECSVCLERLDTSSKVLPCQHTFCRKCLEVIVSSRQELRCPECRVLVDTKIDELPSNILLIRILEGMKNASQNQNNATKSLQPATANIKVCNSVISTTTTNNCDATESTKTFSTETPTVRAQNEQNVVNRRVLPHAFALYEFVSKKTGDLNFKKGDVIILKRKIDANWCVGETNGREGAIPMNYVQVIVPLPVPQCIALYDFKMGPNEEEGCLTFKKGAIINVMRRVDQNWAEGSLGSCIGIFPIAFVEMNALAKQLMETATNSPPFASVRNLPQIPFENTTTSSDSSSLATTSPNSTCSSNTSSNSIPSSPTSNVNSPQHNPAAATKHDMKEKRHSLNAITANTSLSVVQSNRHSAEILTIPEPIEQTSQRTNSGHVEESSGNNCSRTQNDNSTAAQPTNARANVLKTNMHHNQPSLPWAYVALYPYKPRKSDELELKKGCVYFVTERCLDGWYKGKNWADKSGVFPGNYVTPLRNRDQQQLMHQRKTAQNSVQSSQPITSPPHHHLAVHDHPAAQVVAQAGIPPPELPPRSNTVSSSGSSVWAKPLGQHVEAFLNKKFANNSPRNTNDSKPTNVTPKHDNCGTNVTPKNTQPSSQSTTTTSSQNMLKEKDKKEQNSSAAVSLMKRLTNMKRSKSPPNANPTTYVYLMDNPVFEDNSAPVQPSLMTAKHNPSMSHHVHVRSGSCPSQLLQNLPLDLDGAAASSAGSKNAFGSQRVKGHKERPQLQSIRQASESSGSRIHKDKDSQPTVNQINKSHTSSQHKTIVPNQAGPQIIHHRKSQSLDANTISSQITNNLSNGAKSHGQHPRESNSRFRCIVPYPPNSNIELELNVGDIVYVHRKLKDGWYKGTHSRTNKTGLFPASFVEPDLL